MDMKKHLPSADLEKLGKILEIKEAYQRGDISLEEGRTRIREQIGEIRPYEIALAEQELKTIEENECRKEDIQKMIELFGEVMDTNRPIFLSTTLSCATTERTMKCVATCSP